jgi:hypothetical protein
MRCKNDRLIIESEDHSVILCDHDSEVSFEPGKRPNVKFAMKDTLTQLLSCFKSC